MYTHTHTHIYIYIYIYRYQQALNSIAYTKRAYSPPINFPERGTNIQIANCSVYCQYKGGDTNIRRCGTKNCGNTETDLSDKQRFSSLRTNTRMERVLKWYLDRGFVLGRRFVLRAALQGAVTNKTCVVTFIREPAAQCHTVTPSISPLWQSQLLRQEISIFNYCFVAELPQSL